MERKTIKLYRVRDDGVVGLKELSPSQFSDDDSFNSAMDFFYSEGFHDSPSEAREYHEKAQLAEKQQQKLKNRI